jgi:hypothetical protein
MRSVILTELVTEQDSGPGALELIEHDCASALSRASSTHAVALMMTATARSDGMVMASGRAPGPESGRAHSSIPNCRGGATVSSALIKSGHRTEQRDGPLCLERQPDDEPSRHIRVVDVRRLARVRIREDTLGSDARTDDEAAP